MDTSDRVVILLEKARQDSEVARRFLTDPDISDEIVGFHIQQAIEKTLKAVLVKLEVDFPKTHSIELLVDLLAVNGVHVPPDLDGIGELTSFAVAFRYDDLPLSFPFDRREAYGQLSKTRAWAEEILTRTL